MFHQPGATVPKVLDTVTLQHPQRFNLSVLDAVFRSWVQEFGSKLPVFSSSTQFHHCFHFHAHKRLVYHATVERSTSVFRDTNVQRLDVCLTNNGFPRLRRHRHEDNWTPFGYAETSDLLRGPLGILLDFARQQMETSVADTQVCYSHTAGRLGVKFSNSVNLEVVIAFEPSFPETGFGDPWFETGE